MYQQSGGMNNFSCFLIKLTLTENSLWLILSIRALIHFLLFEFQNSCIQFYIALENCFLNDELTPVNLLRDKTNRHENFFL